MGLNRMARHFGYTLGGGPSSAIKYRLVIGYDKPRMGRSDSKKMRKHRGFSLIELLIVAALRSSALRAPRSPWPLAFHPKLEETTYCSNYHFVPNIGVNHGMVHRAVRPLHVKVALNERGAPMVDRCHERHCALFRVSFGDESPYFVFSGSVEKEAQSVITDSQEVLRSSTGAPGLPS